MIGLSAKPNLAPKARYTVNLFLGMSDVSPDETQLLGGPEGRFSRFNRRAKWFWNRP